MRQKDDTHGKEDGDPADVEDVTDPSLVHCESEIAIQIFRRLCELELHARIQDTFESLCGSLENRVEAEIGRPDEIEIIVGEEKRNEDGEGDDERDGREDDVVYECVGLVGGGTSRSDRRRFRTEIATGNSSPCLEVARSTRLQSVQTPRMSTERRTGEGVSR